MKSKEIYIPIPIEEWNEYRADLKEVKRGIELLLSERNKELLTPGEVCKDLGIGRSTFRRWADAGIIQVVQPSGENGRVFVKREILEGLKERGIV